MADQTQNTNNSNGIVIVLMTSLLIFGVIAILYFGTGIFNQNTVGAPTNSNPVPQESTSSGGEGGEGGNINIDVPDQVDVNMDGGGESQQ